MTDVSERHSMGEAHGVIVCLKDCDHFVVHQNSACIRKCGDLRGTKCEKGCMIKWKKYKENNPQGLLQVYFEKSGTNHEHDTITAVSAQGDQINTFAVPLFVQEKEFVNMMQRRFNLTSSEHTILTMRVKHISIATIGKTLHIAVSTVKTHLRNARSKCDPIVWKVFQNYCKEFLPPQ